ncbi:MAG: hypothetical protein LC808_16360 [Actinobacteria bacterium]|nr:hypothetical protein [Actinomycetota bacterium]
MRHWRIHLRTTTDLAELAAWMNPVIRGWMNFCVSRGHQRSDRRAVGLMV